jgi:hypothetical protein
MGWTIGRVEVIEFASFWPLQGDFLANSILRIPANRKPWFFSLELMERGVCDATTRAAGERRAGSVPRTA